MLLPRSEEGCHRHRLPVERWWLADCRPSRRVMRTCVRGCTTMSPGAANYTPLIACIQVRRASEIDGCVHRVRYVLAAKFGDAHTASSWQGWASPVVFVHSTGLDYG